MPDLIDLDKLETDYERVKTPPEQPDYSDAEMAFAMQLYELFPLLLAMARNKEHTP